MDQKQGKAATCRVNLTDSFIAKMPLPESGRQIYWDEKERNLGLRVTPTSKTLFIRVKINSKAFERNLSQQQFVALARDEVAARRLELKNGIDREEELKKEMERKAADEVARKLKKKTLGQALEDFLAAKAETTKPLSPRTIADYRGLMAGELAFVKDEPLEDFTRQYCENLIKQIRDNIVQRSQKSVKLSADPDRKVRTGVRANYALRLVRLLCRTFGIGNQLWNKLNGFDFPWIEEHVKRTGLDPEDGHGTAIWKSLSTRRCDTGASFLQALLLTGCRRGELSGLTVGQVNIEKRTIDLGMTKNRKEHIVYMSDQLVELIGPLLFDRKTGEAKNRDDHVFPTTGDPRKLLKAVGAEVGEAFTPHSLRKYFAINCMDLGVPMPVIKACLNHSTEKSRDVTERHYAHAKPSQMRTAWQRHADTIVPPRATVINLEDRRSVA